MINLQNISLRYPLAGLTSHSFQLKLIHAIGGVFTRDQESKKITYINALSNINLQINNGDRLGILGHNGAGKTSLLRTISGVYAPSEGKIYVEGCINALTDFTLGMDLDVTGIKNIIFRLVFMGYTFSQAKQAIDEIVEFSELGEFIHLPIRTYSTGMFLRLAFAISTHFTPDILILDEIIGTGDEGFKKKSTERIDSMLNGARIVILSSHDLDSIEKYCNKCIVMEHGKIILNGDAKEVIQQYKTNLINYQTLQ